MSYRFKGENFPSVAFTQYHDVYYNTGEKAEEYDRGRNTLRWYCTSFMYSI
jgi:hypothetical protein